MTPAIAIKAFATLFALYVAWVFLREFRVRSKSSRLGGLDSLLMGLWVLGAALLPWVGNDFLPWVPRLTLLLGVAAVTVGLIALRQLVRAHRAKSGA